jgi:hypothetical protein
MFLFPFYHFLLVFPVIFPLPFNILETVLLYYAFYVNHYDAMSVARYRQGRCRMSSFQAEAWEDA